MRKLAKLRLCPICCKILNKRRFHADLRNFEHHFQKVRIPPSPLPGRACFFRGSYSDTYNKSVLSMLPLSMSAAFGRHTSRRARLRIAKSSISGRRFTFSKRTPFMNGKQVFRIKSSRSRMVSRMRRVLAQILAHGTHQTSPHLILRPDLDNDCVCRA